MLIFCNVTKVLKQQKYFNSFGSIEGSLGREVFHGKNLFSAPFERPGHRTDNDALRFLVVPLNSLIEACTIALISDPCFVLVLSLQKR